MSNETTIMFSKDNVELEVLTNHVNTKSGNFKGVCVSACLSYLGIKPNQYKYTWSTRKGNDSAISILRRFGWSVRSRSSKLLNGTKTVARVAKNIKNYNDYTDDVVYYVKLSGHVLLINSNGEVIVDTDSRKVDRRKVYKVYAVFKQ